MNNLKIVVCAKQVPSPEVPPSMVEIDREGLKVVIKGVPPEINPCDETALEAALQLKETFGGKITLVSVGEHLSEYVLMKALAAGADELILVRDKGLDDLDSYSTALVLSKAIKKIGEYDLILVGEESADWNEGQVGLILAELLGVPAINKVKKIELLDGEAEALKVVEGGYVSLKATLPLLLGISSEFGEMRYISFAALKKAREKPFKVLKLKDLEIDASLLRKRKILDLFTISLKRKCEFIEGESAEEVGKKLAIKLIEIIDSLHL